MKKMIFTTLYSLVSLVAVFCSLVPNTGQGQNLVPNGSFEDYTECPVTLGEVYKAVGWETLYRSPDYFNACANNTVIGVPFNTCGYQQAYDGQAYMGLGSYIEGKPVSLREYIGVELTEPLQIGVPVCLSFKLAIGGWGSWNGNSADLSCSGVGMQFFTEWPTNWQEVYLYPDYAALAMAEVPQDTAIWYEVSGSYVPDSAYTKLGIGNFFSYGLFDVVVIDTVFANGLMAYVFIDDVKVQYAEDCATLSVQGMHANDALQVGPNPCQDVLRVEWTGAAEEGIAEYELLDLEGRRIMARNTLRRATRVEVDLREIPAGIYLLNMTTKTGIRTTHVISHTLP